MPGEEQGRAVRFTASLIPAVQLLRSPNEMKFYTIRSAF